MQRAWTQEFWLVAAFGIAGGVVALITHSMVAFLGVTLGGYLAWQLVQLVRLRRWLLSGDRRESPHSIGIWGLVFDYLYRSQSRHAKRKRRLRYLLNRFRESAAALPDATVVLANGNYVEWWNEPASRLLGLNPVRDVGQHIGHLIRDPNFRRALEDDDFVQPVEFVSPQDPNIHMLVRIVPYGDNQRMVVARDISHTRRLEQTRRDFVANASHELRTPLTVLHGYLETLHDADPECSTRWRTVLQTMQQQTSRMKQIVDDLLLLSRLETDSNQVRDDIVDVPRMIENIRRHAETLPHASRQRIDMNVDPELAIAGSEPELQSAFSNLIYNAIQYTPEHGHIEIRWFRDEQGIYFQVSDTGIGVDQGDIPRLTERFYRVDIARSRESGGTGLGLAIVNHVLMRHGATLRIDSAPGEGSTFTCTFPQQRFVPQRSAAE